MGAAMRGVEEIYNSLFSHIDLERTIPRDHPLPAIRHNATGAFRSLPHKVQALLFANWSGIVAGRSAFRSILFIVPENTRACIFFVVAILAGSGGCSLSDSITGSGVDYNQSLEDVTNNMLVTNILLAKDQAPLHFTDLSQIRGALQLQSQAQVSGPFGANFVLSTTRNVAQGVVLLNSSPTFDVVPLNTKELTTCITTPIDLKFLQYYLNRGWLPNYIYNIFIEKIDIATNYSGDQLECEFINHPGNKFVSFEEFRETCNNRAYQVFGVLPKSRSNVTFADLLPILSEHLSFTSYTDTVPYGPEITIVESDLLKTASKLAAGGLELSEKLPSGRYRVLKKKEETAACLEPDRDPAKHRPEWHRLQVGTLGGAVSRTLSDKSTDTDICARSGERGQKGGGKIDSAKAPQVVLYLRSVEAIFTFLGQMLLVAKKDRVLPFDISEEFTSEARFGIHYRGHEYYVNEIRKTCSYLRAVGSAEPCVEEDADQTLFILAILNQTLNLYKNANEIPTTKAVQTVP